MSVRPGATKTWPLGHGLNKATFETQHNNVYCSNNPENAEQEKNHHANRIVFLVSKYFFRTAVMSCGKELATFQVRQSRRLRSIKIAAIVSLMTVIIERKLEQSEKLPFAADTDT